MFIQNLLTFTTIFKIKRFSKEKIIPIAIHVEIILVFILNVNK
jgi:hypothetical protein